MLKRELVAFGVGQPRAGGIIIGTSSAVYDEVGEIEICEN